MKIRISILILLFIISMDVFSQKDTIIYFSREDRVLFNATNAWTYEKVSKMNYGSNLKNEQYYRNLENKKDTSWKLSKTYEVSKINDSTLLFNEFWVSEGEGSSFKRYFYKSKEGYLIKVYNDNNKLTAFGNSSLIFPLIKEGKWIVFLTDSNDVYYEVDYYNNQAISKKNWVNIEKIDTSYIYSEVEVSPEFKGGENELFKFLYKNLKYPQAARENGESGTVYISFVVMIDGPIKDIRISKSVSPSIDREVLRVVKLMENMWNSGMINGKKVKSRFIFPIKISLN